MQKLLQLIILIGSFCLNAQTDCADFRIGKFEYHRLNLKGNYIVERTDSTQIEHDLILGTKAVFKINWTSDCQYEMTHIDGKIPPMLKNLFVDDIRLRIHSTAEDHYGFMILIDGNTILDSGKLYRIE